jgi:hypothetical protein
MLNKRRSFTDSNVTNADFTTLGVAYRLESALSSRAFGFSIFSEQSMSWIQLRSDFESTGARGYYPTEKCLRHFYAACKMAHRMETSLMVEQDTDPERFIEKPITLRFKFYRKKDREAFLEWRMDFAVHGNIYKGGMTGHGISGEMAMK